MLWSIPNWLLPSQPVSMDELHLVVEWHLSTVLTLAQVLLTRIIADPSVSSCSIIPTKFSTSLLGTESPNLFSKLSPLPPFLKFLRSTIQNAMIKGSVPLVFNSLVETSRLKERVFVRMDYFSFILSSTILSISHLILARSRL
jgi:hypothetical protein